MIAGMVVVMLGALVWSILALLGRGSPSVMPSPAATARQILFVHGDEVLVKLPGVQRKRWPRGVVQHLAHVPTDCGGYYVYQVDNVYYRGEQLELVPDAGGER